MITLELLDFTIFLLMLYSTFGNGVNDPVLERVTSLVDGLIFETCAKEEFDAPGLGTTTVLLLPTNTSAKSH